jgi:hypothetical protein
MLPNALLWMPLVVALEKFLSLIALILAVVIPDKIIPCWRRVSRGFDRLARRRLVAVFLVTLLAFIGSMAVSLLVRFPEPYFHDEFSYLLAADTFASGRLTNPPHPLWKHFESFHIIQQPTYASKYPPAQGLILGLGQILGGHPVVGVWLGIALACGAICWMLQAWVPPRWALLGGVIAALNFGFFGYWSQNYWGGATAVLGGALVFGALRRLLRQPAAGMASIMGIGLLILANSRPLEGLITTLPVAVLLLVVMVGSANPWQIWVRRVVVPISGVLFLGAILMGAYNYNVTGNPWRLPYQVYETKYPSTPIFLWSKNKPLEGNFSPPFLKLRQGFEKQKRQLLTLRGYITLKGQSLEKVSNFFLRWVFLLPLVTLPYVMRNRWNQFTLLIIGLVSLVTFLQVQTYPRKFAPVACLIIFIVIQCLRQLRLWHLRGRPTGRCLVGLLLVIFGISVMSCWYPVFRNYPWLQGQLRAQLLRQLRGDTNRHVVVVRYDPNHNPHFDWVYNRADINSSKVIWARELDVKQNQKLVDYYQDRKIWLLEADRLTQGKKVRLVPYPLSRSG